MVLLVCSDFDEFAHALRGADGRYLLKSRGTQPWRLHMQTFGTITTMVARNGAAAIYRGALPDAFALLLGLSHTDTCVVNGDRLCGEDVVWLPPGREFQAPADAGVRWLSLVIPRAEVQQWVDCRVTQLDPRFLGYCSGRADPAAVRRLTIGAIRAAGTDPAVLPPHERRSLLHGELMDAVLAVLHSLHPHPRGRLGRPRLPGQRILDDAMHLMEQHLDQPGRVGDVCAAVGVSSTSLRKIFHERLGVSPQRYLELRRLHAIHWVLRDAGPSDTIAAICGRFGVWDFGRFAARYRQLFGVAPSSLLKQRHQPRC